MLILLILASSGVVAFLSSSKQKQWYSLVYCILGMLIYELTFTVAAVSQHQDYSPLFVHSLLQMCDILTGFLLYLAAKCHCRNLVKIILTLLMN